MEMVQQRMEETSNDKKRSLQSSDMYLEDFKKTFGQAESRNTASKSNMQMQHIRVLNDQDFDDDENKSYDLRKSFGKRGGGGINELK